MGIRKTSTTNIVRNIFPSIAIMIMGVMGSYFVYDTYFSGKMSAVQVSMYEPAAGDELGSSFSEEDAIEIIVTDEKDKIIE